jgi:hypothetical protein
MLKTKPIWLSTQMGRKSSINFQPKNKLVETQLPHFDFPKRKYDSFLATKMERLDNNSILLIKNRFFSIRELVRLHQKNDNLSCTEKIKQQEEEMF